VGREGAVTAIRDVKGLYYLRIMLQRPGADIAAIYLSDTVDPLCPDTSSDLLRRSVVDSCVPGNPSEERKSEFSTRANRASLAGPVAGKPASHP
jgi:hypothetical protein